MKKIMIALLLAAFLFAGCGNNADTENTKDGFSAEYTVGNVRIVPGESFTAIKDNLGEPTDYTEAISCYFDGMDKVFTYDGFEVRTYPRGDEDFVQDLCISSDRYSARGGITIGSALDEIEKAYGKNYNQVGNMLKYETEDSKYIYFFLMNDAVRYFGYAIDVSNK